MSTEKKQYKVKLPNSTLSAFDTLESLKNQPSATQISEFDENLNDYIPVSRKVDGVWINEDQQSLYS